MKNRFVAALILVVLTPCLGADEAHPAIDERLKDAGALVFAGRGNEARLQLHKAIDAYRNESNATGEGVSLVLLGIADVDAGRDAEATTNLESGAVKLEQAGDKFSAVIGLWALAQYQLGLERVDASKGTHERALNMLREAASTKSKFNLDGLRLLGPAVGFNVGILGPIFENPRIVKPIFLTMLETMLRDSYASLLIDTGKLTEAETELARATTIAPMLGGLFDSSIEGHYGDLRRRQWRFDEAREHYRSALEGVTPMSSIPGRDDWVRVSILGKLADIEMLEGCMDEALAWNDQALATVRASNNLGYEAAVLQSRANLLVRGSRWVEAEAVFDDTLALAEILHDRAREASILSDLGWLHVWRGEYGSAVRTFEKSIQLFQNEHHLEEEAAAWMSLAETYLFLDSPDAAKEAEEKAGELVAQSNFRLARELLPVLTAMRKWDGKATPDELLAAYAKWWQLPESSDVGSDVLAKILDGVLDIHNDHIAEIDAAKLEASPVPAVTAIAHMINGKRLFLRGDTAGARALWLKGLDANPNKDLRAGFFALIGMTYWKDDQQKDAVRYFELAAQAMGIMLEDIKSEELLAGYLGDSHRSIFDVTIEALLQQRRDEDAFNHTESARARAFLQSMGNVRLQPTRGAAGGMVREAEALRRSITEWERQLAIAPNAAAAADLRHARERYQVLLKRLESANPEYASLTAVQPMRAADVRQALPAGTTLVSYYVIGGHTHAWIIDHRRLEHVALKTDQARLDRAVCWATTLSGDSPRSRSMEPVGSACGDPATPEEVYGLLFAPLRAKIHDARLIIVPHGDLHYVPFGALRDPKTKRYLLEDYTISYTPSASALKYLAEKESPVEGRSLVIGNPIGGGTQTALPGSQREAQAIARLLGTTEKVGAAATEGLLYGIGGKYDLIHISAHGEYRADSPLFSRIILAKDASHDGNLEVQEILSDVDFTGVNLVVLSACGTARGRRSGGDEIVGLTRAVLYAGAPGVISTLWDIYDDASADLMEEFYRHLLTGELAADALRDAQLSLLRRVPYADPRYWAAFELSGNPQGRWH